MKNSDDVLLVPKADLHNVLVLLRHGRFPNHSYEQVNAVIQGITANAKPLLESSEGEDISEEENTESLNVPC